MWKEFKEFALRGNVVDMAVGIIIGAAFGKVISTLVTNVLMPPIGFLLGRVDFSSLAIRLNEKTASSAVVISYGVFINAVIDFMIVAVAMFIVIKQINRIALIKGKPTKRDCPFCYSSIAIKATRCPNCTSDLINS